MMVVAWNIVLKSLFSIKNVLRSWKGLFDWSDFGDLSSKTLFVKLSLRSKPHHLIYHFSQLNLLSFIIHAVVKNLKKVIRQDKVNKNK